MASFGIVFAVPDDNNHNRKYHTTNTPIKGTIWARVKRPIRGAALHVLVLGEERTQVRPVGTTSHRGVIDSMNFLRLQLPVDNDVFHRNSRSKMIQPGNYEFPFEFVLPVDAPSSTRRESKEGEFGGSFCSISYKISAVLTGSGIVSDHKCSKSFSVRPSPQRAHQRPIPCFLQPEVFPISHGIVKAGSMALGAAMDDTRVNKGSDATVKLAVRNYSSKSASHVSLKLVQTWKFRAHQSHRSFSDILWKSEFRADGLQSLPKGQKRGDSVRDELAELMQSLVSGTNSVTLRIPDNTTPSYKGKLMTISHELHIKINTEVLVTNPKLMIPIQCGGEHNNTLVAASTTGQSVVAETIPSDFENNSVRYEEILVPPEMVTLAWSNTNDDDDDDDDAAVSVILATAEPLQPSVATLLREMQSSFKDLELLRTVIHTAEWNDVLSAVSPQDVGSLIRHTNVEFDQPDVAELLAAKSTSFSCEHVVFALRGTGKWNRVALLKRVLQYCSDLQSNYTSILSELDEWEQLSTNPLIQDALGTTAPKKEYFEF